LPEVKRVLVANRGEIALRIIRACHEEGLEAVAVYSDADRLSPHVRAADQAVAIGPPPAAESYLHVAKLVDAARSSGCQAVHPGYGFLSERAPFAEAVAAAGLIFVGPPASAIRAMGDKTEARRRMQAAGVPIVPGSTRPLADHAQARPEAARLGYPVLLKASAGGGGKGMRLVREEAELEAAFATAASEAEKAFGLGDVYLEKYLDRPRHIEIQILADSYGRVVALGERECSIQRRHQKLVEEAPSVAVTPALRRRLGDSATAAAGAVGYLGAGTIEFLLAPTGEFYFLEMNTRLQVEHPVTELVYGVDIVREQLRVAMGQPLRVHAGTLQPRGHAIECRITSEDPFNDFLPATGVVSYLQVPSGPGVRWDGGIDAGNEVTLYYDPLIAKLIVWGETRLVALERMRRALRELVIVGIPSSQAFHLRVLDDPEFQRGDLDVTYLERNGARLLAGGVRPDLVRPLAVMAALLADAQRAATTPPASRPALPDASARASAWRIAARREALGGGGDGR
jgi:acetyl-CoA carboxylase, biotin carboxylase subunit